MKQFDNIINFVTLAINEWTIYPGLIDVEEHAAASISSNFLHKWINTIMTNIRGKKIISFFL